MTLYLDKVGWTGGGRQITWVKADEEIDPQAGIRQARRLIEA